MEGLDREKNAAPIASAGSAELRIWAGCAFRLKSAPWSDWLIYLPKRAFILVEAIA